MAIRYLVVVSCRTFLATMHWIRKHITLLYIINAALFLVARANHPIYHIHDIHRSRQDTRCSKLHEVTVSYAVFIFVAMPRKCHPFVGTTSRYLPFIIHQQLEPSEVHLEIHTPPPNQSRFYV